MYNETGEKSPNYLILVIILVVFLATLAILVYYIRFQTTIAPRASSYSSFKSISVTNSYIFASPVKASAKGDLIRVTVFVLDDEGNGIYDRKVSLATDSQDLVIKEVQVLTDETGKATFDLSSERVGVYTVDAFVDNIQLSQSLKVVYN